MNHKRILLLVALISSTFLVGRGGGGFHGGSFGGYHGGYSHAASMHTAPATHTFSRSNFHETSHAQISHFNKPTAKHIAQQHSTFSTMHPQAASAAKSAATKFGNKITPTTRTASRFAGTYHGPSGWYHSFPGWWGWGWSWGLFGGLWFFGGYPWWWWWQFYPAFYISYIYPTYQDLAADEDYDDEDEE